MSEWWTYSLADFLLFSDRVYERLFELHNRAFWPAHLATIAIGLAILFSSWPGSSRRTGLRLCFAALGVLWVSVAYAFFWRRYAAINWAAIYVAPFFTVEGLLLVAFAVAGRFARPKRRSASVIAGWLLLAFGVIVYPLLAPLSGRPWTGAGVFGIAPDPTAVATLALLALTATRAGWPLGVVPALWCVVTGATLWTLGDVTFFVAPFAAAAAIGVALRGEREMEARPAIPSPRPEP